MTHVDPRHRRSRMGWEIRTAPTTTPAGTHDHAQRNGPLALAFLCILALLLVNAALLWFVIARGETRDAREVKMRQEIRAEVCKLLGLAPADDPDADFYRAQLRCEEPGRVGPLPGTGPGPEEPQASAPVLPGGPPGLLPLTPTPAPASPPAPPPPSAAPPPTTPPSPPTDAAPRLLDLEPITDPLCAVLGACL